MRYPEATFERKKETLLNSNSEALLLLEALKDLQDLLAGESPNPEALALLASPEIATQMAENHKTDVKKPISFFIALISRLHTEKKIDEAQFFSSMDALLVRILAEHSEDESTQLNDIFQLYFPSEKLSTALQESLIFLLTQPGNSKACIKLTQKYRDFLITQTSVPAPKGAVDNLLLSLSDTLAEKKPMPLNEQEVISKNLSTLLDSELS